MSEGRLCGTPPREVLALEFVTRGQVERGDSGVVANEESIADGAEEHLSRHLAQHGLGGTAASIELAQTIPQVPNVWVWQVVNVLVVWVVLEVAEREFGEDDARNVDPLRWVRDQSGELGGVEAANDARPNGAELLVEVRALLAVRNKSAPSAVRW